MGSSARVQKERMRAGWVRKHWVCTPRYCRSQPFNLKERTCGRHQHPPLDDLKFPVNQGFALIAFRSAERSRHGYGTLGIFTFLKHDIFSRFWVYLIGFRAMTIYCMKICFSVQLWWSWEGMSEIRCCWICLRSQVVQVQLYARGWPSGYGEDCCPVYTDGEQGTDVFFLTILQEVSWWYCNLSESLSRCQSVTALEMGWTLTNSPVDVMCLLHPHLRMFCCVSWDILLYFSGGKRLFLWTGNMGELGSNYCRIWLLLPQNLCQVHVRCTDESCHFWLNIQQGVYVYMCNFFKSFSYTMTICWSLL